VEAGAAAEGGEGHRDRRSAAALSHALKVLCGKVHVVPRQWVKAMRKRQITVTVDVELLGQLLANPKREGGSLANYVRRLIERGVGEDMARDKRVGERAA
jgi:hypothetical protein